MFKFSTLLAGTMLLAACPRILFAQSAPPVLNPPPAAPANPAPAVQQPMPPTSGAMPVASVAPPTEVVGTSYSVELVSGNAFMGVLRSVTATELEFETKDLGIVRVQRSNLKLLLPLTAEQARLGYDDIGNGNRMFFGPTARNLRKGEGYVQNMELLVMNFNYGITDNFSMGAIATIIPGAGSNNLFGLTPKVSFPASEKVRVGGGAMVFFAGGGTAGVTYANFTYGSADNNLTGGVGYGFGSGGFGTTPVLMLGGMTRVSRRVSLLNETYIVRESNFYGTATLYGGIAGLRISGSRISGGLGLLYAGISVSDNSTVPGGSFTFNASGSYPYAELTVRFGKIK